MTEPAWSRRELPFLLLAVALAIASRVPLVRFAEGVFFNGDAAVANLMAKHLATGRFPTVFYGQAYPGGIESFFAAPFYRLLGADPRGFAWGQIVLFALITAAVYRLCFAVGGRAGALAGSLSIALGTMQFVENIAGTHQSYIANLLLGALLMLCGMRMLEQATRGRVLLLGLVTGLGLWTNPQIALFFAPIVLLLFLRGRCCEIARSGGLRQALGFRWFALARAGLVVWLLVLWLLVEVSIRGGLEVDWPLHLSVTRSGVYMVRHIGLLGAALFALELALRDDKQQVVAWIALFGAGVALGAAPLVKDRLTRQVKPVKQTPKGIDVSRIPSGLRRLFRDDTPFDRAALTYVLFNHQPPEKLAGRELRAALVLRGLLWRALLLALLGLLVHFRHTLWAMLTLRAPPASCGLLLALHAAGQIFSFISFPEHRETRYLEALWVPYCALLAGVAAWLARRHLLLAAGWVALLLGFYGMCWVDNYRYLDRLTIHPEQEFRLLQAELERRGLSRGYANFWVGWPITYLSDERIILTTWIGQPRQDQRPEYREAVSRAREVVYIFEDGSRHDQQALRDLQDRQARPAEVWRAGRWTLYRVRR